MDARADANTVGFTLNGTPTSVEAKAGDRLSSALRAAGALDVKIGCNAGDCGACTVLIDGASVCACLMPVQRAVGADVLTLRAVRGTVEGIALAQAFTDLQAAQCGICTPGMMVAATALLRELPEPSERQVMDALGGVLCRCTGYRSIIQAVMEAGRTVSPEGDDKVGSSVPRVDARAKVDGTELFGDDVAPAGALIVQVVRSPHAHAQVILGDTETYIANTPGAVAILTSEDVPGVNLFGVIPGFVDQPVFAEGLVRYRGEAVAAVVAVQPVDLRNFPVDYAVLPAIADVADAVAEGAPVLHEGRLQNVMCTGFVQTGEAEAALGRADVVAEGQFESGFVEHGYIEPEAGYAEVVDGRVIVRACTQAPVMDQEQTAAILGLPIDQVRMVPSAVGGGFGSKLDISVQPYVALAAMKTGRLCRITYTRTESMQATTKRHPSRMSVRIGATKDGRLSGMTFEGDFNTGAYSSWGPTVAIRVPVHASGPYQVTDYTARSRGVFTHNPPAGAFRGFGVPQSAIAQECLFDDLAVQLDMDPLELRILNALENGRPTVCGQVFDQGVGIKTCFEALRPAWEAAKAERGGDVIRRGIGIAGGWYGCGNTGMGNPSTCRSGITADGRVVLHQGAMDIGQGANTVIAQIFATALGVPLATVELIGADTDVTPDMGKTSASRQTFVSGNAARLSGEALRAEILRRCNAGPESSILISDGVIYVGEVALDLTRLPADGEGYVLGAVETYDPPTKPLDDNGQGAPYAQFGYAAHMVVADVDTRLGTVKPVRFVAAHDVGQAINPLLVEGQVHGGIAQGLGMALMEEYIPGRTENLHDYLIPTIGDVPPIQTLIIEETDAHGPYGAKGLGEHVLIPTAPAILNAIRDATGAVIRRVPATPSRVRDALKEAGYE